jgi:prephenate dehydrogenase
MESPPEMWLDLFGQNKEELQKAIAELVEKLNLAADALKANEKSELAKLFQKAEKITQTQI